MLVLSDPIVLGQITFETFQEELAASYVRRFFVTFVIMILIFLTLFIKVVLGFIYLVGFRCCTKHIKIHKTLKRAEYQSNVDDYFNGMKPSIHA